MAGALREAVVTVGKHSGTDRAELDFTWDDHAGTATLTDRGIGYTYNPRICGGTAESVAARCAGVATHIGATPGGGTQM